MWRGQWCSDTAGVENILLTASSKTKSKSKKHVKEKQEAKKLNISRGKDLAEEVEGIRAEEETKLISKPFRRQAMAVNVVCNFLVSIFILNQNEPPFSQTSFQLGFDTKNQSVLHLASDFI